jgi:hypothetical protein
MALTLLLAILAASPLFGLTAYKLIRAHTNGFAFASLVCFATTSVSGMAMTIAAQTVGLV